MVQHPVAALMLCASAGSVALEATGAHPFVVDLHGTTSKGKSTALKFAASLWGNPDDQAGLPMSWASTVASIERRAAFLKHMPTFVDDTKKCPVKEREKLAAVIYGWGVGKARATIGGVQAVATWRSALLSTGEAPLSEIAGEHAGLRMRVLPVSRQPFPDGHPTVRLIEGMDAWGHGGPKVAEWVRLNWDSLPARWEKARDKAEKDLGGQASVHRHRRACSPRYRRQGAVGRSRETASGGGTDRAGQLGHPHGGMGARPGLAGGGAGPDRRAGGLDAEHGLSAGLDRQGAAGRAAGHPPERAGRRAEATRLRPRRAAATLDCCGTHGLPKAGSLQVDGQNGKDVRPECGGRLEAGSGWGRYSDQRAGYKPGVAPRRGAGLKYRPPPLALHSDQRAGYRSYKLL
ncbi:MAG: DUF927 domain-containing protein [Rhodobacteraceae bacterium]|nr:DUF927 domain-containing protein [Paracoccaceae bacterium]